ncbi:MAG: ORF6N domain-containing protein [Bacteroidales bacterium]|nr:ORF6N domain-containing protein [Bacteroidales bacterium]
MNKLIPLKEENIASRIYFIKGEKVMMDVDIAMLYGVETRVLNQAVKRNIDRFPEDFMFQLTKEEFENLKSQFVISSWGGRRKLPLAFTEQGIAMLSGILKSKRAVKVNIVIMRTFVKIRSLMLINKELAQKIEALESKYDKQFKIVFEAIKQLIIVKPKEKQAIGYKIYDKDKNKNN